MASEPVVLADAAERDLTKLDEYRAVGGYESLARARDMEPDAVVEEILTSHVRGGGGGFFSMGRKAGFLAEDTGNPASAAMADRGVGLAARFRAAAAFYDAELLDLPETTVEAAFATEPDLAP